jgi:hypothetical protein
MVAVNIVIVTRIATENVILIVEEGIVTRTGIPMVAIVEIGVTAAAQHHHGVADVTRPTIGVAEATQEVPPEVAVPCAEEVGITTLLQQSTLQPRLQPIPRLVGKGIILEMVCTSGTHPLLCRGPVDKLPRSRRSRAKVKFKQGMKRFLLSWPSFVVQVSSSNFHLYDLSYMVREETSDWDRIR